MTSQASSKALLCEYDLRSPAACTNISDAALRFQLKVRSLVVVFYTLSIAALWFIKPRGCRSFVYTWYGMLPLQVHHPPGSWATVWCMDTRAEDLWCSALACADLQELRRKLQSSLFC